MTKPTQEQKDKLVKLCVEYYDEEDTEPSDLCDCILDTLNNK